MNSMDPHRPSDDSRPAATWQAPEGSTIVAATVQAQNQSAIEQSFSPLRIGSLPLNITSASGRKGQRYSRDSKDLALSLTAAGSELQHMGTLNSSGPKGKRKKKVAAKIKAAASKPSL